MPLKAWLYLNGKHMTSQKNYVVKLLPLPLSPIKKNHFNKQRK
jgi:hypothetical protein